jgi:hypothetical protein
MLYMGYFNYVLGFKTLYYASLENYLMPEDVDPIIIEIINTNLSKKVGALLSQLNEPFKQCVICCRNKEMLSSNIAIRNYCYILLQLLPFIPASTLTKKNFIILILTYFISFITVINDEIQTTQKIEKTLMITQIFFPALIDLAGEYAFK